VNLSDIVQFRHSTKAFDSGKKIPADKIAEIEELLRFSPSSINSQPWHFVIAASDDAKQRIAQSTQGASSYNEPKILNASHVVVLCARQDFDDAHLQSVIAQEEKDGRFSGEEARAAQFAGRAHYVNLHRFDRKDTQAWMEKQAYIALGTLLLGAGMLQIDACPIEGFDPAVLDAELGLREKGLTSLVVVPLGYRGEGDFNAKLPKSRLSSDIVISHV